VSAVAKRRNSIITLGEIPMTKSFLVGLFLTSLFLFGCGANRDSSSASSSSSGASATPGHSPGDHAATTQRIPAYFSNVADAKPFPAVLDPRQFSEPSVVKAYSYAKELPEIFSQQPCYCHCDAGNGHRSLLDCFATDHGAT
jgi:hypothetical protein